MNFKSLTTNIQCGATIKSRLIVDYKFNDKRSVRLSHFSTSWTEILFGTNNIKPFSNGQTSAHRMLMQQMNN
jgi:hypothetical protein